MQFSGEMLHSEALDRNDKQNVFTVCVFKACTRAFPIWS